MTIFVICVGSSLLSKATDVTLTPKGYNLAYDHMPSYTGGIIWRVG